MRDYHLSDNKSWLGWTLLLYPNQRESTSETIGYPRVVTTKEVLVNINMIALKMLEAISLTSILPKDYRRPNHSLSILHPNYQIWWRTKTYKTI